MTKESVIINEIEVAGCMFLKNERYLISPNCILKIHRNEVIGFCKNRPNCYYKQLQRKTQECERYYNEWINSSKLLDWHKQQEQYMQEQHFDLTMKNQELTEELTSLQQTYEACEKEYKALNEKYIKVLELAKKGVDSYEYRIRELEEENQKIKAKIKEISEKLDDALDPDKTEAEESLDLIWEISAELEKLIQTE